MTDKYKQSAVSHAVWPWQGDKVSSGQRKPALVMAFASLGFAWVLAGLVYFFLHPAIAIIVICISSFFFFCGQFLPTVYGRLLTLFQKLSRSVGVVMSWLMLVPFFYICFGGGRLVLKITGKDPMKRGFDSRKTSYWEKRKDGFEVEQYRKQF